MKFLQNKKPFRLAVVVSKSVARKAVERNRLRRAAYDSLSSPTLAATGHALFFVRSIPKEPLRTVFKKEITALLSQAPQVKI